ncbi:hypothetical protein SF06_27000 [Pseudomonas flexibilis]|nr:hypothetical protein SF06_27000 [Pseudomonas flexibilis]
MRSDFKELHITGFTFFKTAYADGYRDEYKSSSEAISLATGSGNHDPDDELRIFKEIYLSFKDSKCIYLDSALQQLMLC